MTTHSHVRGRGLRNAALAACLIPVLFVPATDAFAAEDAAALPSVEDAGGATAASPTVVSVRRVAPPRRKVVRHRFQPWGRPTPGQVRRIIRIESRRWGIHPARLARRVACESNFRWWAGNGPYQGLLQFHSSTFARGLGTLRTRRVAFTRERWRRVRTVTVSRYSDGRVVREPGRPRRQRVVAVYSGRLPSRPPLTHAWAQLRIGAQAIRGISAVSSSEWSCPA